MAADQKQIDQSFSQKSSLGASQHPTSEPIIVGLTGGIGSGKSTVAAAFRQLGIVSVDADQAARAVVEPGMPALTAIAEHFGEAVMLPDGGLNRAALREIIFSNPAEKQWLESLLHPLIREWIVAQLQAAKSPYVILESPLLFETNQHLLTQATLLVDVPVPLQITRAAARDGQSTAQIESIIAAQMPREEKRSRATYILDNSLPLATLDARVLALHNEFMRRVNRPQESIR